MTLRTCPILVDGATEAAATILDIREHMTPAQMVAFINRYEADQPAFLLALCTVAWRAGHRNNLLKVRLSDVEDELAAVEQEVGSAIRALHDRLTDAQSAVNADLFTAMGGGPFD